MIIVSVFLAGNSQKSDIYRWNSLAVTAAFSIVYKLFGAAVHGMNFMRFNSEAPPQQQQQAQKQNRHNV